MIQYYRNVIWDSALQDVGTDEKGLVVSGLYTVAGAPAAKSNRYEAAAIIQNINDGIAYLNSGTTAAPTWSELSLTAPSGSRISVNTAGLRIAGGSGSANADTSVGFSVVDNNVAGVPVAAATVLPVLNGGNLAFDNGTVPVTTLSCRMYTFLASVNATTGATTLSVVHGNDFPKHRPMIPSIDINYGDGITAIVGYLYVKNESSAVFIPGTTHLDASGITAKFDTQN